VGAEAVAKGSYWGGVEEDGDRGAAAGGFPITGEGACGFADRERR
jgi:hypothetical protein